MSTIGERIKRLRENSGKLQKEVASDLGITTSALGLYEINYRKVPPELLVKIAKYFNVTTDYILGNENKHTKERIAFFNGIENLSDNDKILVQNLINSLNNKNEK